MLSKRVPFSEIVALLYPDRFQVRSTVDYLDASKVLCLSDTNKVFLGKTESSHSIAVHLDRQMSEGKGANETSHLELTQADCSEFRYSSPTNCFGAHLPQNKNQARREYRQIDNAEFKSLDKYDLIFGRSVLCCCNGPVSCGGIDSTYKDQKKFIDSLLATEANLIVLSSNWIADDHNPKYFLKGKNVLLETCKSIALFAPDYEIIFGDNLCNNLFKGKICVQNSGHILILAKKTALEIYGLPKDAIRFRFEESADRLVRGFEFFKFHANLPKKLILTKGTNNCEEVKSFTLNPSQQKELYSLRNVVGENIITKQKERAVYEVNCDYLIKLKDESPEGFKFFAQLLNVSLEQLATLITSDLAAMEKTKKYPDF